MPVEAKICKSETCSKTVTGRSDRAFCSRECKSEYHYANLKREGKTYFKAQVDSVLRKNRAVLAKHNIQNGVKIDAAVLSNEGFNPNFFTHQWTNLSGDKFSFCYDQGFCELKSNFGTRYILASWQKGMEKQVSL